MKTPQDLIAEAQQARRDRRVDDALHAYEEAAALSRAQAQEPWLAVALCGLGQTEHDRGNLGAAQQHYAQALEAHRRQGDPLAIAHTARHLGDLYRETHQPDRAEPLLQEALALYRQQPDTPPLASPRQRHPAVGAAQGGAGQRL